MMEVAIKVEKKWLLSGYVEISPDLRLTCNGETITLGRAERWDNITLSLDETRQVGEVLAYILTRYKDAQR